MALSLVATPFLLGIGHGGSVINLSTIPSTSPVPNSVVYSASKSAVDTITRALATDPASRKIRVNAIAPGMTETEGLAVAGTEGETAKNRLGRPDDIAHVAVFLASDQSVEIDAEFRRAASAARLRG